MRCVKPFVSGSAAFGCGQCMPCRSLKQATWAHRIILEATDVGESNCSFVTLTYRDEAWTLEPKHTQDWLKRLRKRLSGRKLRYYLVGEYGEKTFRPHYHAALFGVGPCRGGIHVGGECQCPACSVVRETWGYGFVMVAPLAIASAQYIAGYVTKKMTHRLDTRLGGRHPEFARMSLNPGIGADAMHNVASDMMRWDLENTLQDVPFGLRYGRRVLPLGRYLRGKLRKAIGREENAPAEALQEGANKLQLVRRFAWDNDRSVSSVFEEINSPYAALLTARDNRKGKKL